METKRAKENAKNKRSTSEKKEPAKSPEKQEVKAHAKSDKQKKPAQKMCKLPLANLQAVCDFLNGDDIPLPQNQVRKALKLLFAAELIEEE